METEKKTYEIVDGVEKLEAALESVRAAQRIFAKYTQEQVDAIFLAAATAANQARIPLAKMAVEETGMGIVEDKVIKNLRDQKDRGTDRRCRRGDPHHEPDFHGDL